jgi:hypothetical protein
MRAEANTWKVLRLAGPAVLLAGLSGCGGCGSGPDVVKFSPAENRLTQIAMAYGDAQSELGHPPKNAEELKPFLKPHGDPDDLLVSPNDGQPYVIVWGADVSRGGPTDYKQLWQVLAYEQKGARGHRAVTDVRGRPMNVPDAEFSSLTFVRGHKPAN